MTTLLVTKPKALSSVDKTKLRKADIIVLEAEDPDSVRWLKPGEIFCPDDMMRAALYTISQSYDVTKSRFVNQLAIIAKANESAPFDKGGD